MLIITTGSKDENIDTEKLNNLLQKTPLLIKITKKELVSKNFILVQDISNNTAIEIWQVLSDAGIKTKILSHAPNEKKPSETGTIPKNKIKPTGYNANSTTSILNTYMIHKRKFNISILFIILVSITYYLNYSPQNSKSLIRNKIDNRASEAKPYNYNNNPPSYNTNEIVVLIDSKKEAIENQTIALKTMDEVAKEVTLSMRRNDIFGWEIEDKLMARNFDIPLKNALNKIDREKDSYVKDIQKNIDTIQRNVKARNISVEKGTRQLKNIEQRLKSKLNEVENKIKDVRAAFTEKRKKAELNRLDVVKEQYKSTSDELKTLIVNPEAFNKAMKEAERYDRQLKHMINHLADLIAY